MVHCLPEVEQGHGAEAHEASSSRAEMSDERHGVTEWSPPRHPPW